MKYFSTLSLTLLLAVYVISNSLASNIAIGNKQFKFIFEDGSGRLTGITNRVNGEEYIKDVKLADIPFKISLDGKQLNSDDIKFSSISIQNYNKSQTVTLKYEASGLAVILDVQVTDTGNTSIWNLKLTNTGEFERTISVQFPAISGICIGADRNNNMVAGSSDGTGWVEKVVDVEKSDFTRSGDRWYGGSNSTMQWNDTFDKSVNSGLGMVVKDVKLLPKVLENTPNNVHVRYMDYQIKPNGSIMFPATTILVHTGDWKVAADEYSSWFKSKFKIAKPPKWFVEDKYNMLGIEKGNRNDRIVNGTGADSLLTEINSFRNLTDVLDDVRLTGSSVVELSNFQDAWPKYHVANDGDYDLRDDLGGAEAFKEGVKKVHERGGKVILYIEGFLTWKDSRIGRSGDAEKWAIRNPDGSLREWYPDRWHECVSEKGWQDYLVRKCVKFVKDYDVDGFRLDSLGATGFNPCYSKSHEHYPDPYTWGKGLQELVSKVKAAITKVKPDAVLLVEGPIDYLYQWVDGSLATPFTNDTIMKYTFPEIYLSPIQANWGAKSPSISEVNGYPWCQWGNSNFRLRQGYSPEGITLERNWSYIRKTFKDALIYGKMEGKYPVSSDPNVLARTYSADDYYLILGTRLIPGKDKFSITFTPSTDSRLESILIDANTMNAGGIIAKEDGNGLIFELNLDDFAIFIPKPNSRAIAWGQEPSPIVTGNLAVVDIPVLNQEKGKQLRAKITIPGLIPNIQEITIPCQFRIPTPQGIRGGRYVINIDDPTGKTFMGTQRVLNLLPPVDVKMDAALESNNLVVTVYLKNNTDIPQTINLSGRESSKCKIPQTTVTLSPNEQKSVKITTDIPSDIHLKVRYIDLTYKIGDYEDWITFPYRLITGK